MNNKLLILALLGLVTKLFAQSVDMRPPIIDHGVEWSQEHTSALMANLEESGFIKKNKARCKLEIDVKYRLGEYLVSVLLTNTSNGLKSQKHYSCSSYGDELLTNLAGGWDIGGNAAIGYPLVMAEPGLVTLVARDSGILDFNGEKLPVTAGRELTIESLLAGSYTATMRYEDDYEEQQFINVIGGNVYSISFLYEYDGFILVESGSFSMGSPTRESGRDDDENLRRRSITRNFRISPYEVTQGEYKAVTGYDGYWYQTSSEYSGDLIGPNKPVVTKSWYDIIKFCNKLSIQKGLTPCYTITRDSTKCDWDANGYRLPLDSEWEYAARGGQDAGSYNIYAGSDSIGSVAWYDRNSGNGTHPGGEKQPNELGLYDMSGNVREWCWGWPGSDGIGWSADEDEWNIKSSRGGSWDDTADHSRVANRDGANGSFGGGDPRVGFRLVRTVP
jgi:formylglycine-generating enzyme required for sulfatase activity